MNWGSFLTLFLMTVSLWTTIVCHKNTSWFPQLFSHGIWLPTVSEFTYSDHITALGNTVSSPVAEFQGKYLTGPTWVKCSFWTINNGGKAIMVGWHHWDQWFSSLTAQWNHLQTFRTTDYFPPSPSPQRRLQPPAQDSNLISLLGHLVMESFKTLLVILRHITGACIVHETRCMGRGWECKQLQRRGPGNHL